MPTPEPNSAHCRSPAAKFARGSPERPLCWGSSRTDDCYQPRVRGNHHPRGR
jgi:hypothetical protein